MSIVCCAVTLCGQASSSRLSSSIPAGYVSHTGYQYDSISRVAGQRELAPPSYPSKLGGFRNNVFMRRSLKLGQAEVKLTGVTAGEPPLHENRTLIFAVHHLARAGNGALRHEQADRPLQPEEPRAGHGLCANAPQAGNQPTRLLDHEAERVADYVAQIAMHQQPLVLVDRETRPTVGVRERQLNASLHHAVPIDHRLDPIEQTETGIFQIHGVDRLCSNRNPETFARDNPLLGKTDNARHPPSTTLAVDAVEIDEVDRFVRTVAVRDTAAQPGADERQVRIAVARLGLSLFLRQFLAQVQFVMLVAGTLWKYGLERAQVRLHARAAGIQS